MKCCPQCGERMCLSADFYEIAWLCDRCFKTYQRPHRLVYRFFVRSWLRRDEWLRRSDKFIRKHGEMMDVLTIIIFSVGLFLAGYWRLLS